MNLNNILSGKKLPEDIYVIIEIPANSYPIKYEVDKDSGAIFVDRFLSINMPYPCNYGYINHTLSLDGDPLDVLVPTPYPLQIGTVILCRPIGVLKITEKTIKDPKLVAIPHSEVTKEYEHIKDINDLPSFLLDQIKYFFEHYKDLEKDQGVKIEGWGNSHEAKYEILSSLKREKRKN